MTEILYEDKKTGKLVLFKCVLKDVTTGRDGEDMVLYQSRELRELFVRNAVDFYDNFNYVTPSC